MAGVNSNYAEVNKARAHVSEDTVAEGGAKDWVHEANAEVRRGFIRKVYAILFVQLTVTAVVVMVMNINLTRQWLIENRSVYTSAQYISLGTMIGVVCCCKDAMRTYPSNYVVLGVMTACMSAMCGFISVLYTTESVMLALFTTAGVCGSLSLYACYSKTDFTGMGPYLMAALSSLMVFAFVMMIASMISPGMDMSGMKMLYTGAGVLIFSLYIVYDTQLVIGGTHKQHQFGIDDYAFAALSLYLDIVNMFIYLLSLLGDERR